MQTKQQRYKAKLKKLGYKRLDYILPPCVAAKVASYVAACMTEFKAAKTPPDKPQSPA